MSKRKKIASVAFTGAAATAAVGFAVGPAHAAGSSWHANQVNGKSFSGHNITPATLSAVSVGGGTQTLSCPKGTASTTGHVSANGKSGVPAQLGTVSTANFGTNSSIGRCHLQTISFSATLNAAPLAVVAKSPTTPDNSTGVTKGFIGKGPTTSTHSISATVTGTNLACHLVVTGKSIPGSLHNTYTSPATGSTRHGLFVINPNKSKTLTITQPSGCLGLFASGAPAGFFASYSTTPSLSVTGG